jgi:hypothetical protein
MSLATWKHKYYQTPAFSIKTERGAIKHSLRKWVGLRSVNLKKYGVFKNPLSCYIVSEDKSFGITFSTCALCCLFYHSKYDSALGPCVLCPLHRIRGYPCDVVSQDENISPYYNFTSSNNNPEPMIALLKEALKKCNSK